MSSNVLIKAPHWSESWLLQWVVLIVLFAVAFALWQFAPVPPQASSWLASEHYLSVAQELAQGHGFTLVANPVLAQSVADTPPLYPLLLAGIMQATGNSTWADAMPAIMSVQLGLYFAGILLVFMFTRVRLKGARALLLASWFTLWPSVWGAAKVPGPEMLALVCILMALWVTDKYFAKTGDKIKPAHVLHCSVWCVASVLALPKVGLVLMLAFALLGYVKMGVKRGSNAVLGMAVVLLPWFLWFMSRHSGSWQSAASYLFPEQSYLVSGGGLFYTPVDTALDWIAAHSAQGLWGSIEVANIPIIGPILAPQFAISQWSWGAVGLVRWVSLLGIMFGALVGLSQFSGVAGGVVLLLLLLALATGQVDILAHPAVLPFTGLCTLTGLHWVALGLKEVQLQPIGKMLINAATVLVVLQTLTLLPTVSVGANGLTAYTGQAFYHAHNGFSKPFDSVLTALPSDMAVLESLVNWRHRAIPAGAASSVWFSNVSDLVGLYAGVPVVQPLPALDANLAAGVRQLGRYYCWFSPAEKAGGGVASTIGTAQDVMLPAGLPTGATLVFQRRGVRVWHW